ncbi:hypothetical protein DMUE_1894 [Dictyocoela muelleri]|nr:hypothetical protein DMUE_1894 [Dictyocoela muelleri]
MMYVIMKGKNQNYYNKIFEIFLRKIETNTSKYIILDVKKALFNSMKCLFQNYTLIRCYFHMTQILMKFLKSPSFINHYKENHEFKNSVKYLLIFPEEEVIEKYNNLSKRINQKDDNYKKVYEYFYKKFLAFENRHPIKKSVLDN